MVLSDQPGLVDYRSGEGFHLPFIAITASDSYRRQDLLHAKIDGGKLVVAARNPVFESDTIYTFDLGEVRDNALQFFGLTRP